MSDILGRSAFREDLEKDRPDFFEVARKWKLAQAWQLPQEIADQCKCYTRPYPNWVAPHWHDDVHVMD